MASAMSNPRNEVHAVGPLAAEAIGEPGSRTFRIVAGGGGGYAMIWLEKEQLFQLALAIQQILASSSEEDADPAPAPPPGPGVSLDFKVGKLALGRDGRTGLFMIDAHDLEEEDEESATVRVWVGSQAVREFSEEAMRVCAAGRPICPLCGSSINPDGHPCSRVNGHAKTLGP